MNDIPPRFKDLKGDPSLYYISDFDFAECALELFEHQASHCEVYKRFLQSLGWKGVAKSYVSIPFLPIETFKHRTVKTGIWEHDEVFESSGTSGLRSRHFIRNISHYHQHAIRIFENHFGDLKQFQVLALLPNYVESGQSSLVSMVKAFQDHTGQRRDAFHLRNFASLQKEIRDIERAGQRLLLFGVTFALLDFARNYSIALPESSVVIETGGMKGRGEVLERNELHAFLRQCFCLTTLYSEYGMTELLSQAYGKNGRFIAPPSMKILIKEINDPMSLAPIGQVGVIHIVDLANSDTCAFIGTSDLGIVHEDQSFEVVGRMTASDLRGCHQLYLETFKS